MDAIAHDEPTVTSLVQLLDQLTETQSGQALRMSLASVFRINQFAKHSGLWGLGNRQISDVARLVEDVKASVLDADRVLVLTGQ